MKKAEVGIRSRPSQSTSRQVKPQAKAQEVLTTNGPFPVVSIGASAGGLEAYTDFFRALPVQTGMAFVLVQHLDPSHHSMLSEIIAKATSMPVEEVQSGARISPNHVYVIPHNALMVIADGVFTLTPRSKVPGQHLAINSFMRSLADERKSRAIGIVLSGTGSDGAQGLEYIKAEGGITFAQEPATAKYDGMPRSAIDSGCVDFVLAPQDIARELQRITTHPYVSQDHEPAAIESTPSRKEDFDQILGELRKATRVDFSQYKPNTIHRRAMRRMVVLKLDSLRDYARYLKEHEEETQKLFDDVLIPVTSFFRDFEAFEALKSAVFPAIVKDKGNKGTIRMWAPGCSTGEETYSLAMTLLEFLGDRAASFQVQIFGTDLNEKGIQKARTGVYRESIADHLVLKHHAPAGVIINRAMEVIQFRGRTTPYLEPAPGKPSLNVLRLARNGLAMELRALIGAAVKKKAPVHKDGIAFESDGHKKILNISVLPLEEKGPHSSRKEEFFLLLFEEGPFHDGLGPAGVSRGREKESAAKKSELRRLKEDLGRTRDALRAAVESESALKEEFQTANEEILSANEELQSTNEELETSKEELQSANEELSTLNDELRHKNTELHDLNNDISNFLNSTRIPVVMLDRRLRIRRITPTADKLLKAVPADIGRSITDIRLNIRVQDLERMIARVLDTLQPLEREVEDMENRWHSLHILPYRTLDNQIDGVVLVLRDIDAMRSANEQLRKSGELFHSIINTVRQPLLVLDSDLRIMTVNQSFLHTFKVSREQTAGKFLYRLGNEQWNIPRLRALLEDILPKDRSVTNFEVEHEFEHVGRRKMMLNARKLSQPDAREAMILLAIEDVTQRKLAEAALLKSEKLAASARLAAALAHEINNPLQAVTNLMTLLGRSPKLDPQDQEYATLAAMELGRVVHLVRQSLGFYRESASPTRVDLEEVLESVLSIFLRQIESKQIVLTRKYQLDGTIESYPGEIRQVFSTLLVNAIEACTKGCRIVLRARHSHDWKKNPAARGVRIVLADTGGGIPYPDAARIFEPFFTTKGEKGTGLGLWVARGVVERLGGSIRMRSTTRPGSSGTCFSVFLPADQP